MHKKIGLESLFGSLHVLTMSARWDAAGVSSLSLRLCPCPRVGPRARGAQKMSGQALQSCLSLASQ